MPRMRTSVKLWLLLVGASSLAAQTMNAPGQVYYVVC